MTENAERRRAWLEFLAGHEEAFNEEFHLLTTGRKHVECLPPDGVHAGAGWFLVHADTQAGEWNLAHAFGRPTEYLEHLRLYPPQVEFHLLVPLTDAPAVSSYLGTDSIEHLTWFRDAGTPWMPSTTAGHGSSADGLEFLHRAENADGLAAGTEDALYEAIYAREHGSVVGLVKCIHLTPHTAEVYIETSPGWRNRGIASRLLGEMLRRMRRRGLRLLYVVSAENAPSLRLAEKAGLKAFQTLSRFPFTRRA
ncbi:MAG TPA: GNAT family N-acetyltransferase [Candidatus Ozemobacteraceae bacterium]|nr:GNAT family N-acetyltransferase [Candidatus Ozemobacteraceae bacterium]